MTTQKSNLPMDAAAHKLVDSLVKKGISTFFGVPGGPICPLFEAIRLNKNATLIESRHETSAAFSAISFAKITGKIPVLAVTAGPGITNAVTGIASAHLERIPMLVIAGDVAWSNHGGCLAQNSGPEGIDAEQLLSSITRCQIRISRSRSAVTQCFSALQAAIDPNCPGPVLLILPIDEAMKPAPDIDLDIVETKINYPVSVTQINRTVALLSEAKKPLIILGAGCYGHSTVIERLVNNLKVPFVTTPRAKGIVSEKNPYSLRNCGMAASMWARNYMKDIDVALVLGTDLDDTSVGSKSFMAENGKLIHVDINSVVFNRNFPTDLGILNNVSDFVNELNKHKLNNDFNELITNIKKESAFDIENFAADESVPIAPHKVIAELQEYALPETKFVTDIGEHMLFALHYLTTENPNDFNIQLNLGSMGSGIAGAVGLALADPTGPSIICICGDGGMQMVGMEILTAIKHNLPIVFAIFNDARYNMVYHGMRQIFGDSENYDTPYIDFIVWAKSLGVEAAIVTEPNQIPYFLIEFQKLNKPAILDIRIDREIRIRGGGRIESLQKMSMVGGE